MGYAKIRPFFHMALLEMCKTYPNPCTIITISPLTPFSLK
jgi:inosine-uridine nucleoside N-ribohydrolase